MTVTSTTAKADGVGNGVATDFSFSFTIFASTDLEVTLVESDGTETLLSEGTGPTKYSVAPTSTFPGTGTVTYPADEVTPMPTGDKIVIKRVLPLTQLVDLENQGPYLPDVQEQVFDRLLMICLQQQEEIDRSIKTTIGDAGVDLTALLAQITQAVTDAETAETGAQTAETGALAAKTAAETAQTAAETAQTAAETAEANAETAETGAVAAQAAAEAAQKTLAGINTQTGTSYTAVLGDAGKVIEMNNASANTFTVPPNSSVAFAVGTVLEVVQYGAGQTTVAAGAGVTIRSAGAFLNIRAQYGGCTLYKRATDEWVLNGDMEA